MSKLDYVLEYAVRLWPVAIALIGLVAWLVRVDGRTSANSNEIARVESRIGTQRKEDMERIDRALSTIAQDVKELLSRK